MTLDTESQDMNGGPNAQAQQPEKSNLTGETWSPKTTKQGFQVRMLILFVLGIPKPHKKERSKSWTPES